MNTRANHQVNQKNILAILNNNVIKEESQKDAMLVMGLGSCNVACMTYKCCTGHGRGGKHSQHSYKINY